jgi:hypothetical protein
MCVLIYSLYSKIKRKDINGIILLLSGDSDQYENETNFHFFSGLE